jgi:NAD(P)-dependent dehydrogenase (short-subunit alcohol dehydrogenase family)
MTKDSAGSIAIDLTGKVAIVTGAASWMATASAAALATAGASVILTDVDESGLAAAHSSLAEHGADVVSVAGDLTVEQDVERVVERALEAFGRLDILFNNHALTGKALSSDDHLHEMELEFWNRVMAVNVTSYMLCAKHALKPMLAADGGVIINTTSVGALTGFATIPAYCVSKTAVEGLTRSIATQYGKRRIRCVSVAPGLIDSRIYEGAQARIGEMLPHLLTTRIGRPADIANVVCFLASDLAGYITGCSLTVDGGLTAHEPDYAGALLRRSGG